MFAMLYVSIPFLFNRPTVSYQYGCMFFAYVLKQDFTGIHATVTQFLGFRFQDFKDFRNSVRDLKTADDLCKWLARSIYA